MKNIALKFIGFLPMFLFFSCTKEAFVREDADPSCQTIERSYEASYGEELKTDYKGSGVVDWQAADVIRYYSSDGGTVSSYSITAAGHTATIKATVKRQDDYLVAAYGGSGLSSVTRNSFVMEGTVGAVQSGQFKDAHVAASFLGNISATSLKFYNITSVIAFTLSRTDVRKVVLTGNQGERLHGNGKIDVTMISGATAAKYGEDGGSSITVNPAGAGTFYMGILPTRMAKGFTMYLYNASDVLLGTVSFSGVLTIAANNLLNLGTVDSNIKVPASGAFTRLYVNIDQSVPVLDVSNTPQNAILTVNDKVYPIMKDSQNRYYVDAATASDGKYRAHLVTESSCSLYPAAPGTGIRVPHALYYDGGKNSIHNFPMYGYVASGTTLNMKRATAFLDILLKGSAGITSIKVSAANASASVSGTGNCDWTGCKLNPTSETCLPTVVMNCAPDGIATKLTSSGVHFYFPVFAGTFTSGFNVSVCDESHKVMNFTISNSSLSANQVVSVTQTYAPYSDIYFYEAFDRCVWGGDRMAGSAGKGYSPLNVNPGISDGLTLQGNEFAYHQVPYNWSGSPYIQRELPDAMAYEKRIWESTFPVGKGVSKYNSITDAYVRNKGFEDYRLLAKCQEYPGYLGVGCVSGSTSEYGVFQTPLFTNIPGIVNATVSFNICAAAGSSETVELRLLRGGYIKKIVIDGVEVHPAEPFKSFQQSVFRYIGDLHLLKLKSYLKVPSSDANAKKWQSVELTVEGATSSTTLLLSGSSDSSNHGFYVDNIICRKSSDYTKWSLRILVWNIANGMWADQENNYDNFVAWIKKMNPDICIFDEAATIYKDRTNISIGNSGSTYKGYLPAGWSELASRFSHSYTAIGGQRDNYPQVVTSKYPITTVQTFTTTDDANKPISHGAGHFTLTVSGKKINVITMHPWPQGYRYGCPVAERDASIAKGEGDLQRLFEEQYVLSKTIKDSKYSSEQYWVLAGDMNSCLTIDKSWSGCWGPVTADYIVNNTNLTDVLTYLHPGELFGTIMNGSRYDYIFLSPAMLQLCKNGMTMRDAWVNFNESPYCPSFLTGSDHLPVIADFNF